MIWANVLASGVLHALEAISAATTPNHVEALLDAFVPQILASPEHVENTLQIKLEEAEATEAFIRWISGPAVIQGVRTLETEFRTPRGSSSSADRSMIVMRIDPSPCILLENIRQARSDLTWEGAPSAHSTDPDVYWVEQQAQTSLALGFAAYGEPCLRTIVYRFR